MFNIWVPEENITLKKIGVVAFLKKNHKISYWELLLSRFLKNLVSHVTTIIKVSIRKKIRYLFMEQDKQKLEEAKKFNMNKTSFPNNPEREFIVNSSKSRKKNKELIPKIFKTCK